jgi:hypothetical protein
MTRPAVLRSLQNSIDAVQPRIKAAGGYVQRGSVVTCRAELVAVVAELNRVIGSCTRAIDEAAADDRQLELFRASSAV